MKYEIKARITWNYRRKSFSKLIKFIAVSAVLLIYRQTMRSTMTIATYGRLH